MKKITQPKPNNAACDIAYFPFVEETRKAPSDKIDGTQTPTKMPFNLSNTSSPLK